MSRRSSLSFANGTHVHYDVDLNGDLSSIEMIFNGSSVDFAYEFNKAHQVIGHSISNPQFLWDPFASVAVGYDQANSLNQYLEVESAEYSYNQNGCLTNDDVWTFGYDAENHLVSADNGTTAVAYSYDPMHRQVQKNVNGTSTRFLYSGWQRIAEYDATSGALQNRYVYGSRLDEPLIKVSSSNDQIYMYADRLGSVAAHADETGAVTERFRYSPYGESESMTNTTFGFTGQRFDEETSLYYFKNRYYSPFLGRFLQPDPVPNMNVYTYVLNDPLNLIDSLGLDAQVLFGPNCAGWAHNENDRSPGRPNGNYSGPKRTDNGDAYNETYEDYYKRLGWDCTKITGDGDCPTRRCYKKILVIFDKKDGMKGTSFDSNYWHELGYNVSGLTQGYCGWSQYNMETGSVEQPPKDFDPVQTAGAQGLERYCCYKPDKRFDKCTK